MLSILRDVHLVVAGNLAAAHRPYAQPWPNDPVFVFDRSCTFVDADGKGLAIDPNQWLSRFAAASYGVQLHWAPGDDKLPDWLVSGLANAGTRWTIGTVNDAGSDLWQGTDLVNEKDPPDDKTWRAVYRRVMHASRVPLPPLQPLVGAIASLKRALDNIIAFNNRMGGGGNDDPFGTSFREARTLLDAPFSSKLDTMYFATELPWEPARLLAAARAAWVFGGMGAWNDRVYDPPVKQDFERVTEALYRAICDAATAAANSTFPIRRAVTPN
jgi:hypothetical protein